jgi:hypothetical protein
MQDDFDWNEEDAPLELGDELEEGELDPSDLDDDVWGGSEDDD